MGSVNHGFRAIGKETPFVTVENIREAVTVRKGGPLNRVLEKMYQCKDKKGSVLLST